jgi:hypothetical protein
MTRHRRSNVKSFKKVRVGWLGFWTCIVTLATPKIVLMKNCPDGQRMIESANSGKEMPGYGPDKMKHFGWGG